MFVVGIFSTIRMLIAQRTAVDRHKKEINQSTEKAVTDEFLQELLKDCIKETQLLTGTNPELVPVNMGMAHASEIYKKGCYVFIQNFEKINEGKSSKDDRFVRFNFRAVQFRDEPGAYLEALVWHPSHGNADQMKMIFRSDADSGRDMFIQLMATAINVTSK